RHRGFGEPGRPVVRTEPHRQHGRRRDRPAGDLGGDIVVPEQRIAVLDRRARRPDVTPLDRELPGFLVLHLADHLLDVRRYLGRRHAPTPSPRSPAISAAVYPASPSRASVSVIAASRTCGPSCARTMPASTQPTCSKDVRDGDDASTNAGRSRNCGDATSSGTVATSETHVSAAPSSCTPTSPQPGAH